MGAQTEQETKELVDTIKTNLEALAALNNPENREAATGYINAIFDAAEQLELNHETLSTKEWLRAMVLKNTITRYYTREDFPTIPEVVAVFIKTAEDAEYYLNTWDDEVFEEIINTVGKFTVPISRSIRNLPDNAEKLFYIFKETLGGILVDTDWDEHPSNTGNLGTLPSPQTDMSKDSINADSIDTRKSGK